jgi:periplasmic copper chaperone A
MKRTTLRFALALAACLGSAAHAHDHAGHQKHAARAAAVERADPQAAIPLVMKAIFESPGKPLSAGPVVIAGNWAIADWSQDKKGGRALLKDDGTGWAIYLCSGSSLGDAKALRQIGLTRRDAKSLAASLAKAESGLAANRRALFDSFQGAMLMKP